MGEGSWDEGGQSLKPLDHSRVKLLLTANLGSAVFNLKVILVKNSSITLILVHWCEATSTKLELNWSFGM